MSGGCEVLGVLDPEAAVARAVLLRHTLEDVELQADRAVTDRVDYDLEARAVCAQRPGIETLGRRDEQARCRPVRR